MRIQPPVEAWIEKRPGVNPAAEKQIVNLDYGQPA